MAVSDQLEQQLQRWTAAGVVDVATATRIREYEAVREAPGVRWPVIIAIAFGAIMVAAGVLLFVAAHWDNLSPTQRFLLVLAMCAGFHLVAGAVMTRMRVLGMALHAIGTVALGGGIFLAGQIFNLEEHWPSGILLWAIGAVISWAVLRDWLQATLSALLVPAWIASEWTVRAEHYNYSERFTAQFAVLLAIAYLSARRGSDDSHFRRALMWVGGIALLPAGVVLALMGEEWPDFHGHATPPLIYTIGLMMAFLLPSVVAYFLRGKDIGWNVGYAAWAFIVPLFNWRTNSSNVAIFALSALGAVGLCVWGLQERRRERINLGVVGFAITIIVFYFSNVMDKLGRSASLVGFGLLFLLGGWQLERLRRKLVARTKVGVA